MTRLFFTLLIPVIVHPAFSQSLDNNITYTKVFGGYKFEQNGEMLNPKRMLDLFQGNEEAYEAMKKAKANYDPAMVLSVIGGALIGWPLGTAIGGGDPNWALAGIGAVFVVGTIPLSKAFNRHAIRAVDIYNAKLQPSASAGLYFGATGYGIGIGLRL